jgi:hypothetical protein
MKLSAHYTMLFVLFAISFEITVLSTVAELLRLPALSLWRMLL